MIIKANDRETELNATVGDNIEISQQGDTVAFFSADNNVWGSVAINEEELARLVASNAPFSAGHRDAFFRKLREFADQIFPTD